MLQRFLAGRGRSETSSEENGSNGKPAKEPPIGKLTTPRARNSRRLWASRWRVGQANFYPDHRQLFERNLGRLIREYVIPGFAPPEPLLDRTDTVVTLGSCFAAELRTFLKKAGATSSSFKIPESLFNTYAILDFFSWCATGAETGRGFRYDRLAGGEICEWTPEAEREAYAAAFGEAGAFVFTIGLAEVWEDRETGGVFWRGIPEEIFDEDRHVSRVTTVEENAANLEQIIELVRRINAEAPIVLTLSPVPLRATFQDMSCIAADCISKSVLRAALAEVMSKRLPGVYYWPSFEVVRWVGAHLGWPAYGVDDDKARHVTRYLVGEIMDAFVEAFYRPEAVEAMRAA